MNFEIKPQFKIDKENQVKQKRMLGSPKVRKIVTKYS